MPDHDHDHDDLPADDEFLDDPDLQPPPEAVRLAGSAPIPIEKVYNPGSVVPHAVRVEEGALAVEPAPPAPPPPPKAKAGTRWVCSAPDCGAVWTQDPGPHHTHEVPVSGSKSRKRYVNHDVHRVEG